MGWIQTSKSLYQTRQLVSLGIDAQGRVSVTSGGVPVPLTDQLSPEHGQRVFARITNELARNLTLIDVPKIVADTKDPA